MLLDYIQRYRGTACWLPNFAFLHIVRTDNDGSLRDLSSVRLIVNCSEPCRAQAFDRFIERYKGHGLKPEALQVSYAMAENVFAVTQTIPGSLVRRSPLNAHREFLSSGRVLPGVELKICDEQDTPLGEGQLGRILLRSTHMFQGYFRDPVKTAQACSDGWYRTGDLGFMHRGELFVIGRYDDIVTINGKNIVAHEVENAINEVAGVLPGRVLLFSSFDPGAGTNQLIVLAESGADERRPEKDVMAEIRRLVLTICGIYPHSVRILMPGFLVKSSSGKINRPESIRKFEASLQPAG